MDWFPPCDIERLANQYGEYRARYLVRHVRTRLALTFIDF